jgi:hypothetical protein
MMTPAFAIIIPLSLLLYSNSRITEAKETGGMAAGFSRMSSEIPSLKADLKIHELEHHHK